MAGGSHVEVGVAEYLTTGQCAALLNHAYGGRVVSRQSILRDVQSGRLDAQVVPARGTRRRALIRVRASALKAYAAVYHQSVKLSEPDDVSRETDR